MVDAQKMFVPVWRWRTRSVRRNCSFLSEAKTRRDRNKPIELASFCIFPDIVSSSLFLTRIIVQIFMGARWRLAGCSKGFRHSQCLAGSFSGALDREQS